MFNFKSKKRIEELEKDVQYLSSKAEQLENMLELYKTSGNELREKFPLDIDEVVYDVELRNDKGRYTKKNASREHSCASEVTVTEKNYFNLVRKYRNKEIYLTRSEAEKYIESVCVN